MTLKSDQLLRASILKKEQRRRQQIQLPYQDTPFLKALQVDYSFSQIEGVKIKQARFSSMADLLAHPSLDWDSCVFKPILDSIQQMKERGYEVLYKIASPLNILEGILPFEESIKASLKYPDEFQALTGQLKTWIADFCCALDQQKVDYIYFFDSFASVELLGLGFYKKVYGPLWLAILDTANQLNTSKMIVGQEIIQALSQVYSITKVKENQTNLYSPSRQPSGDIFCDQPILFKKEVKSEWN